MQGLKNSLFFDAHIFAVMMENGPPKWLDIGLILATFSSFFARSAPEAPRPPSKSLKFDDYSKIFRLFSKILCKVLQIRGLCRSAGFADMHVLQIRRFGLSRAPAFVPASASAAIADANCIGVRR